MLVHVLLEEHPSGGRLVKRHLCTLSVAQERTWLAPATGYEISNSRGRHETEEGQSRAGLRDSLASIWGIDSLQVNFAQESDGRNFLVSLGLFAVRLLEYWSISHQCRMPTREHINQNES